MKHITQSVVTLLFSLFSLLVTNTANANFSFFSDYKPKITTKFIIISHGQKDSTHWSVIYNGARQAAALTNTSLDIRTTQSNDFADMADLIKKAASERPNGIIVSIPEASPLAVAIADVINKNIPIISIHSGANAYESLGITMHIGQDEYSAGKAAGQRMSLYGDKHIVCVNHDVSNITYEQRCKGIRDGFDGEVTLLETTADALAITLETLLSDNPDIDSVVTMDAKNVGELAIQVIDDMRYQINVNSFDLSNDFLTAITEGKAVFGIDQQYYLQGYLPVIMLAQHAQNGIIPTGTLITGPQMITTSKVSNYRDSINQGIR